MGKKKGKAVPGEDVADPRLAELKSVINKNARASKLQEKVERKILLPLKRVNSNPLVCESLPLSRSLYPESRSVNYGFDGVPDVPNQVFYKDDLPDDISNDLRNTGDLAPAYSASSLSFATGETDDTDMQLLDDLKDKDPTEFVKNRIGDTNTTIVLNRLKTPFPSPAESNGEDLDDGGDLRVDSPENAGVEDRPVKKGRWGGVLHKLKTPYRTPSESCDSDEKDDERLKFDPDSGEQHSELKKKPGDRGETKSRKRKTPKRRLSATSNSIDKQPRSCCIAIFTVAALLAGIGVSLILHDLASNGSSDEYSETSTSTISNSTATPLPWSTNSSSLTAPQTTAAGDYRRNTTVALEVNQTSTPFQVPMTTDEVSLVPLNQTIAASLPPSTDTTRSVPPVINLTAPKTASPTTDLIGSTTEAVLPTTIDNKPGTSCGTTLAITSTVVTITPPATSLPTTTEATIENKFPTTIVTTAARPTPATSLGTTAGAMKSQKTALSATDNNYPTTAIRLNTLAAKPKQTSTTATKQNQTATTAAVKETTTKASYCAEMEAMVVDFFTVRGKPVNLSYVYIWPDDWHVGKELGVLIAEVYEHVGIILDAVKIDEIISHPEDRAWRVKARLDANPKTNLGVMLWYGYNRKTSNRFNSLYLERFHTLTDSVFPDLVATRVKTHASSIHDMWSDSMDNYYDTTPARRPPAYIGDWWGSS